MEDSEDKENLKMNREDLSRIIEETILEMLEEGDESLVGLMIEHEKHFNGGDIDRETFINETIDALKDNLGVLNEVVEEDNPILDEQRKMLSLIEYLDTGNENVLRERTETTFNDLEVGDKFEIPGGAEDDVELTKISKTHYKVTKKGHAASGTKYNFTKDFKPNQVVIKY